jgi:sporulation protein YlmC with PRC-barrel domain
MLTEHGHEVGTISDLDIDFATGAVTAYVLSGSLLDRLRKENHTVPVSAIKSIGEKLVVVSNDVVAT